MVAIATHSQEPNTNWNLDQLAQFIGVRLARSATDAWKIGEAFVIAKSKVEQGKFTAWKRQHGFSDNMVSRYTRLFEHFGSPDELKGIGVIAACEKAGMSLRGPRNAPQPPMPPAAPGYYSWAVKESNNANDGSQDDKPFDVFVQIERLSEAVKQHLEKPSVESNDAALVEQAAKVRKPIAVLIRGLRNLLRTLPVAPPPQREAVGERRKDAKVSEIMNAG